MIFTYLLLLAPLSFALAWFHAPPLWVFVTAAAAIVRAVGIGVLISQVSP